MRRLDTTFIIVHSCSLKIQFPLQFIVGAEALMTPRTVRHTDYHDENIERKWQFKFTLKSDNIWYTVLVVNCHSLFKYQSRGFETTLILTFSVFKHQEIVIDNKATIILSGLSLESILLDYNNLLQHMKLECYYTSEVSQILGLL